jgi:beta-glucanase (GH16 family)
MSIDSYIRAKSWRWVLSLSSVKTEQNELGFMMKGTFMKKTLWLSVAAFCLLSGVSFAADNLLTNNGFETNGVLGSFAANTNPNRYPSGWEGWGLNGSLHSDVGYRSGTQGVSLSWNDTGLYQDFAAVEDRAYTISADVITPSSAPIKGWTGQISVEWYNELGGLIRTDIVGALTESDPVDTWKLVKNTIFAPEYTYIGRVVLKFGGGGTVNSGKAYFDNVAVIGLQPDYNNDDMVNLDDFATASATWLETSEITDLTGDSFFGLEDLGYFVMNWLQPIPDYELVWSDEFDGNSVDANKWVYDVGGGGWGNSQLEYDTNGLNASVSDGNLIIEGRREDYGGRSFTSTRMKTKNKFSYQYGTVEIRANIPDLNNGLWPALWTMGNTGGWPANGELDIMEMGSAKAITDGVQNRKTGSAAHWESGGSHASYSTSYTAPSNLTGSFHIWEMDWTPTAIFVYLDGTLRWSFTISGGVASDLEEFHHSFYILMNLAVGGTYTGITSVPGITAQFPARMYIDYVRVYKKAK